MSPFLRTLSILSDSVSPISLNSRVGNKMNDENVTNRAHPTLEFYEFTK